MRRAHSILIAIIASLGLAPRPGVAAQERKGPVVAVGAVEGLSLEDVYAALERDSPRLEASHAAAQAASLRRPASSALPDPSVQLGLMNLGLPDLRADRPMTMAPSIQLMQAIPFPGKRTLRSDMADLDATMASASAEVTWWDIRRRAAGLFFDLYRIDRHLEVQRTTLELLGDLETVTQARYSSGTGTQADVLRAHVEVARMEGEILRLEGDRTAGAARLNALLRRAPDSGLASPVLPPLPVLLAPGDSLHTWALESNPALERARQGVERSTAAARLADRDLWPDLVVGLQYGQRNRGQGTERMGSALLGFSIPIHASSRQRPLAEAAEVEAHRARVVLTEMESEVYARLAELGAELHRTRSLVTLYRDEVLPQARVTVASAMSAYRAGQVDFTTLLDAELIVNRFELELHLLVRDYGSVLAAIEAVLGRPLPPGSVSLEVP